MDLLNEYALIVLAGFIVFLIVYFDDNGDGHA